MARILSDFRGDVPHCCLFHLVLKSFLNFEEASIKSRVNIFSDRTFGVWIFVKVKEAAAHAVNSLINIIETDFCKTFRETDPALIPAALSCKTI